MQVEDLRQLSPSDAMQAAAKELSLPNDFFDRMWAQESGRGQNMRSAAGARGHFQVMPPTQSAWEKRDGKAYNPDDFYDGLYLASSTMRENLAKFKDPVNATRAYNSGWDPSKWGNPETVGYVSSLWGAKADTAPAPTPGLPVRPKAKPEDKHRTIVDAILGSVTQQDDTAASFHAFQSAQDDAAAEQARKDASGTFGNVFTQASGDPRNMPTWAILNRFTDDNRQPDPSWDYMAHRDKLEAGLTEDERLFVRENAVSDATAQKALGEVQARRDTDKVYADGGAFKGFAGQMAAGLTDPTSLLAAVSVGKAFQASRIANAASPLKSVAIAAAEGAAANVAIEGISDAMGEVKTSADYASAAAMGAALTLPFARGHFRQAAEADAQTAARGIQERATQEQVNKVTSVMERDPSLTPEQVARTVEREEANAITRTVGEESGPQRLDRVVPDDVVREQQAEFEGTAPGPEPAKAAKETTDSLDLSSVEQPPILEQLRKGEVTRKVNDSDGSTITLNWSLESAKQKPHGNLRDTLEAIQSHPNIQPVDKRVARYLSTVMSEDGLDMGIRFSARKARGNFDPQTNQVSIHGAGASAAGELVDQVHSLSQYGIYSVLHEVFHAATYHRINAWEEAAAKLSTSQRKTMQQFQDLYDRFKEHVAEGQPNGKPDVGATYAATNLHEFAAQIMTDSETRYALATMPGKPVAGRATNALNEVVGVIKRILGLGKDTGFDEATKVLDRLIAMPVDNIRFKGGEPVFAPEHATGESGKPNPILTRRARDTWAERMVDFATKYIQRNPIDLARTKVLTSKIGGTSDGLVLAASKNPIMQLVASLVAETTTGAAGRKANVAIRSTLLHRKYIGDAMLEFDNAYAVFRNKNGGGILEDAFKGDVRRKFDESVYEEVLRRRYADYTPHRDGSVVEAADQLQAMFDRARMGQIEAGVLGHDALPETSKGYMPQALDGTKLQAASVQDMALLHDALAKQFEDRLGWDAQFAKDFAPFYTERVRRRAMGDKGIDGLASGGEGMQLIRDTLDEMGMNSSDFDRARAASSSLGQSHTRKRLDVDLLQELRPGLRMMDFYNTNPLLLARSYARRTAGTVALTEAGIHGIRGVRELRQASLFKQDGTTPSKNELDAFDRVMSEILGTPSAGQRISAGASNMQLLVTLQKLGGLVFTQSAEAFNMIHHLGLRSLLSGVPELPRLLGEVGRLKRGAASGNHLLTSLETYGGEIGMEHYKMIAPLDAPDHALSAYQNQPGLVTRLLRAGGHLQSKVSGFRGVMAAQHRMTAEQIVMKAARYIRDGGDHIALKDMGFTPEIVASMKPELKRIAEWDATDRLVKFDLSQVSDPRTAEAFVQAVHRGTSQIIQGTFPGERNKWFHDDWMRLLMQLRTFGLTASEKQWGRTRMNHGYAYAAGVLLGQMALSLPIHMARVQLASVGRPDREDYIKNNLSPGNLVRAVMNYSSISGSAGDVLGLMADIAGGWGDKRTKDLLGASQEATTIGRIVPVAGTIDSMLRVAQGKANLNTALKQLPFSNLWYLTPAVNLTKDH